MKRKELREQRRLANMTPAERRMEEIKTYLKGLARKVGDLIVLGLILLIVGLTLSAVLSPAVSQNGYENAVKSNIHRNIITNNRR